MWCWIQCVSLSALTLRTLACLSLLLMQWKSLSVLLSCQVGKKKKTSFSMTLCNSSSPLNPFITTYYHWQIQITVRTHNKSLTRIWNRRLEHFFVFFSDLLWENFCSQFIWQHEPIVHLYYLLFWYLITSIWVMKFFV